ncbi:CFEM domain-containing protein [Hirsutella rhossiliensis]|uniref:CFEM domain-containing protein n=1 Tax=Hirsutella rhossiliensis TaxID=111463 RepID=A0A9P8N5T4_9HYPO|nr:CFEM domain-containing protein [Hirsutella rhossiliensis]KAH0967470.1 CFEM domain-containing protein [Hirsutella rhossiliensis]
MGRFVPLILGAWSALQLFGAVAQDVPTCIPGCANQLRSDFAKFSCQSATDAACLCQEKFISSVVECSAKCKAKDEDVRRNLGQSFCAGHLPSAASSSSVKPGTPSSAPPPSTATPTSATPVSTSAPPSSTSVPPSSTSSAPASTQASTSASSTSSAVAAATSATSASETSVAASQTSAALAGAKTSEAAATDPSASALSQASVVGIGVGVGAAVIAIAGIVLCLLLRSRKRTPRPSMDISKPLPGSGRAYAGRDHNSFEKYGNDIEMTTNRYEDMVPRQQPRTMV